MLIRMFMPAPDPQTGCAIRSGEIRRRVNSMCHIWLEVANPLTYRRVSWPSSPAGCYGPQAPWKTIPWNGVFRCRVQDPFIKNRGPSFLRQDLENGRIAIKNQIPYVFIGKIYKSLRIMRIMQALKMGAIYSFHCELLSAYTSRKGKVCYGG